MTSKASIFGGDNVFGLWLAIFIFCTLVNGVFGRWWVTANHIDFNVESARTASAILHFGEFRDPFVPMPTGPTSHVAPAYPVLSSAILAIFGTGKAAAWTIRLLTIGVYALALALLPLLAAQLGLSKRTGLAAAVLGCLIPIPGSTFKWEALFTALFLVLVGHLAASLRSRPRAVYLAIPIGLLCGIGLLFSPVMLLVLLAWALLIVRSTGLKPILVIGILAFLILTPWLIRDYKVFHAFIFIRDNLGTELAASNNDCASAWTGDNPLSDCFSRTHPNASVALDQRIVEVGENKFNAERLGEGVSWIREHTQKFAELTARRCMCFWIPLACGAKTGFAVIGEAIISVLTLASVPGLFFVFRRSAFAGLFLTAVLLLYPLVYYLVQVELRFRYPILWVTCMAAAAIWTERGQLLTSPRGTPSRY